MCHDDGAIGAFQYVMCEVVRGSVGVAFCGPCIARPRSSNHNIKARTTPSISPSGSDPQSTSNHENPCIHLHPRTNTVALCAESCTLLAVRSFSLAISFVELQIESVSKKQPQQGSQQSYAGSQSLQSRIHDQHQWIAFPSTRILFVDRQKFTCFDLIVATTSKTRHSPFTYFAYNVSLQHLRSGSATPTNILPPR